MKKLLIFTVIIICIPFLTLSADNRIMVLMDSIPNTLESVDIPFGFENDAGIYSFSNGFLISASGDLSVKWIYDTVQLTPYPIFSGAYKHVSDRTEYLDFRFQAFGEETDSLLAGSVSSPPPGQFQIQPGPMDTIFWAGIRISGSYGDICIDSLASVSVAGNWLWDGVGGNLNPEFNDGDGPHCMPYIAFSADNRIMVLMDSIPNTQEDSVHIPFGFENDDAIAQFSNGFFISASGDLSVKWIYDTVQLYPFPIFYGGYKHVSDRTEYLRFYSQVFGRDADTALAGCYWEPPPYNYAVKPGPMDTIFWLRARISGSYGEICIDSLAKAGPAGTWHWEIFTGDFVYPEFNDGNGPHCMPYYHLCGDANRDGSVDISDIIRIVGYIFGTNPAPDPMDAADTNCDGTVDVSDAVVIVRMIFLNGHLPCDTDGDGVPDC